MLLAAGARHVRTLGHWRPAREWARREETRIYSIDAAAAAWARLQDDACGGFDRCAIRRSAMIAGMRRFVLPIATLCCAAWRARVRAR